MNVTITRRRIAAAAATLALAAGGVVAGSTASSAAPVTGHCKVLNKVEMGDRSIKLPSLSVSKSLSANNCILNSGDNNGAVLALQQTLNACYVAGLTADGVYGPKTKEAVRKAQAKAGLKGADVDGVYGPKTGNIIDWLWIDTVTGKHLKCDWFIVYM